MWASKLWYGEYLSALYPRYFPSDATRRGVGPYEAAQNRLKSSAIDASRARQCYVPARAPAFWRTSHRANPDPLSSKPSSGWLVLQKTCLITVAYTSAIAVGCRSGSVRRQQVALLTFTNWRRRMSALSVHQRVLPTRSRPFTVPGNFRLPRNDAHDDRRRPQRYAVKGAANRQCIFRHDRQGDPCRCRRVRRCERQTQFLARDTVCHQA
ncbi:hypothetical protein OKW41_004164 [Paraburkholderia sp. UCT70]